MFGDKLIVKKKNMYYDRTISSSFANLISPGGELRWLFNFVKSREDLDFLIGKNNSVEWISVYRGLTRILSIRPGYNSQTIKIIGDKKYSSLISGLYGVKNTNDNFLEDIKSLIKIIPSEINLNRYYENKKEGFFQNELSRIYGINSREDSAFVIIDKEAVVGYEDTVEKNSLFGTIQSKYKNLQKRISDIDEVRYGAHLEKKAMGNEVDFIGLDREGNILLIEYKHGTNTSGIYLSPLQIGLYNDIFTSFPFDELKRSVLSMLRQKQDINLINPLWSSASIKSIIPVLIISEYNYKSSAQEKFTEIMKICKAQEGPGFLSNLRTFNYTQANGLNKW